MRWTEYDDVESDPEKLGGTPVMKGTRVPVDAIIDNFDGFLEEGLDGEESALMVYSCFPTVELVRIQALLAFRNAHNTGLAA